MRSSSGRLWALDFYIPPRGHGQWGGGGGGGDGVWGGGRCASLRMADDSSGSYKSRDRRRRRVERGMCSAKRPSLRTMVLEVASACLSVLLIHDHITVREMSKSFIDHHVEHRHARTPVTTIAFEEYLNLYRQ